MGLEGILALMFVALLIVFLTLGGVLLAFFWLRRFSVTIRSIIATATGALVLFFPAIVLSGAQSEASLAFLGAFAILAIIGFPVALLATRKLERHLKDLHADIGSVFE